ncbi:MAG: ferrous iron transport protein A [Bacteriovoracaceae bacterium]|nr:ferrous iron transport protein A [Bacteriovoracaceae bacterium]
MKSLIELYRGERSVVTKIHDRGILNKRLRDIGIYPGAEVIMVKSAPLGDPLEIKVNDNSISLRIKEADKIEVE